MLVSVVIPCYNSENYLAACLASVYGQSHPDIEVICIDNNSSDDTFNTLINFKEKYPNLIVDVELKAGATAARNKGLSLASGEWIQFLDADDLLLPSKIEHQVRLINQSDIAFIAGNCFSIKEGSDEKRFFFNFTKNVWVNLISSNIGCTCSNLFNFSVIKQVGMWNIDQKSSQETELMFRILKFNSNILLDNEPLTLIRSTPNSISNSNREANIIRYIELRIDIFQFLKSTNLVTEKIQVAYYKSLFNSLIDLSSYNLHSSACLFNKLFPRDHKNLLNFLPKHKFAVYSILGFKMVRQVHSFYERLFFFKHL